MASTKLTNSMRDAIVQRVLDHAFGDRERALKETEHRLAAKAYDRLHPKKIREAMAALPRDYLPMDDSIIVSVSGCRHRLRLPEHRPAPSGYDARRLSLMSDDKLSIEITKFASDHEALENERREAEKNARAVLDSVTTLARLVQVWPEVEVFAADLETKPVVALAVRMDDLNAALRLPPEQRAA